MFLQIIPQETLKERSDGFEWQFRNYPTNFKKYFLRVIYVIVLIEKMLEASVISINFHKWVKQSGDSTRRDICELVS